MLKIMQSNPQSPSLTPQWQDLTLAQGPDPNQLDKIKAQLDLVLLALEALAGIDNDAILQAANQLNLESKVPDRVLALWRLRQSSSRRQGERERTLDVEEARSLVLVSCYLAKQHQELIRRAVALMEQLAEENQEPHKAALLGDYLDTFSRIYQERKSDDDNIPTDALNQLALKFLIDLLFYSGPAGHRYLWLALLNRSEKGIGA